MELSRNEWKHFEETSPFWREFSEIAKARMGIIMNDLLDKETTPTLAEVRALQAEYQTCLWALNIPRTSEEKGNEKETNDSA